MRSKDEAGSPKSAKMGNIDGRGYKVDVITEQQVVHASQPAIRRSGAKITTGAIALLLVAAAVQAAHAGVHLFMAKPVFASDLLQAMASGITVAVCIYKAFRERQHRQHWIGLTVAFAVWTVAQSYLAFAVRRPGVTGVPFSELLGLMYSLPMLLVILHRPQSTRRDPAGWFDAAQAGIFFFILIALFIPAPGIISMAIANDVQGVAMLLVLVLRYCAAEPGRDRIFFRNVTAYMAVYVCCCILYYFSATHGFAIGSMFELCWSVPFTFFSVLALCTDLSKTIVDEEWRGMARLVPTSFVQGVSALGLAIMSMTASAVLAYHRPIEGAIALAVAFILFAGRSSAREWQLQAAHKQLNYSVLHDPLTSVANRTRLDTEITRRLGPSQAADGSATAILFIGLDRFKTLNDCLGHAFGDLLLQRIAELLSGSIRKQDLVARYGGDEFVILLDSVDATEAGAFANRMLDMLKRPLSLEDRVMNVTASIGYAMGAAGATAAGMVQEAHFAMHHAKRAGRDRAQAFERDMVRLPQYRLALETDLRKALAEDAITVSYQPIFAVETGEIEGFEALARWAHPERGNVSPADFIAVAEDTGLIMELGLQVLRKACRQCQQWNRRFGTAYTMNVNVSAHQFASPDILTQILNTLYETGLPPRLLKLEITESVLISGYTCVEEVLAKAQEAGIQICLDDFGTGYSSLSYLLDYPFDVVKIDQSFVRRVDEDPRRAEVVRTLIELAANLKKHVVAEGVERAEEMACLKRFGCELAQGYLMSKPLSTEKVAALLTLHKRLRPEAMSRTHRVRERDLPQSGDWSQQIRVQPRLAKPVA